MQGPSGTRRFKNGLIYDNIDSHEVRLTFEKTLRARFVKFRIRQASERHPPRISRYEIFGSANGAQGSLTATFAPQRLVAWGDVIAKGSGISRIEWRPAPTTAEAGEWSRLESRKIPSPASVPGIQLRVFLENTPAIAARLDELGVTLDGVVAGAPEPLVPALDTQVANRKPTLLWSGGVNSGFLAASRWRVQISRTISFAPEGTKTFTDIPDAQITVDPGSLAAASPLLTGSKLYWRVGRLNTEGEIEIWSAPSTFTLGDIPAPRYNDSPFGMNMGLDARPWGREIARDAGFKWVRLDIPWYKVQPESGEWNWQRKDRMVAIAREQNISLLGILGYPPRDQSTVPAGRDNWRTWPPASESAWVDFITRCATRYRNDVAAWEIWNEHNHRGFFSGTPEQYARLLQLAYITVKNISPDALVTFGGHAGFSPHYLDRVTAAIGDGYWDILNWHCYPGMPDDPYYQNWLTAVFDYQRRNAVNKPIWLTEIGSMRRSLPGGKVDPVEEDKIAAVTVAHLVANLRTFPGAAPDRIDKIFWFQLIEGHGYGKPQPWAMVIDKTDPQTPPDRLPVFKAYAHAVRLLDGAQWLDTEKKEGVVWHHFRVKPAKTAENTGDGWTDLYVIWAAYPWRNDISLEPEASRLELRDMYGNRLPASSPGVTPLLVKRDVYFILSVGPCEIAGERPGR
jgi:hypothetical protein